jgi:hypothetical protein
MTGLLPAPPVITIRPAAPGEDGDVPVTCHCGTTTWLVIDGLERLTQRRELAFRCSCQRVRWYAVGPPGEVGEGEVIVPCD